MNAVTKKNHRNTTVSSQETDLRLIDEIAKQAITLVPSSEKTLFKEFIHLFYVNTPQEILLRLPKKVTAEALGDVWEFVKKRKAGVPKLQVYYWRPEKKYALAERIVIDIMNDNMSFLLDSLYSLLQRLGTKPRLTLHPLFKCVRNSQGLITKVFSPASENDPSQLESFIHCEIVENITPDLVQKLEEQLPIVLKDVLRANQDWAEMRQKTLVAISELTDLKDKPFVKDDVEEVINFLRWIEDDHFTYLGYCNYDLSQASPEKPFNRVAGEAALGILKDSEFNRLPNLFQGITLNPSTLRYIFEPNSLIVNKTTKFSNVHRNVQMDCIGVRRFDKQGKIIGIRIFVGLFTSVAYDSSARDIPLLRQKVLKIIEKAGFKPEWHDGKALIHILDSLPRDELFQASIEELAHIGLSIVRLEGSSRLAFFMRRDQFDRFLSCLVYIPRDRFDSELCERIGQILAQEFQGEAGAYKAQFGSLPFARVHYTITSKQGFKETYDIDRIEQILIEEARSWTDELRSKLSDHYDEIERERLYRRYRQAFGRGYQERFSSQEALQDIIELEDTIKTKSLRIRVYSQHGNVSERIKIKIYNPAQPIALSDALPTLENLDLRVISEIPFKVTPEDGEGLIWIHDFELESRGHCPIDLTVSGDEFAQTFLKVTAGEIENDAFNRLVLRANLNWQQAMIFRAYSKYIRQLQVPFSKAYLANILTKNPIIVMLLIKLFEKKFDPQVAQEDFELYQRILDHFDSIDSPDEDRALRIYLNLIAATIRTNAYQQDARGRHLTYLSFKFNSRKIDDLPLPKPLYEIFVYSPRMEAIHLRGGKIARGGIRWSDRLEDFRTETLGLMKAQMVKNAVIVPVGSKGGFIVKTALEGLTREQIQKEGIECYKTMMRGLLDLTDNLLQGRVIRPQNTVCWDKEDPYLVVAADKGTATFSDIANEISHAYQFWLGDAFASGGSAGYDHKKMGITARGAWESVKRHFRELGKNIQKDPFTVIGVGDMSGDVFGNGMLLSKKIKLVAAFNHLHIFIDPNPDAESSFEERQRLFNLPRSTWDDYNKSLLSKGGGVFARSAKTIKISKEIQDLLKTAETILKPNDLIRRLLTLEVDLLWFGGIGTFVKGSQEKNPDVGDRSNDNLRIDASDLKCKVIGEGANLGITQLGRIEFARKCSGKTNTDFIDNSGGVSCSDREVNIKILFNSILSEGKITLSERNRQLEKMTDKVAQLVLYSNYQQPQALSFLEALDYRKLDQQVKLMRSFEQEGFLNRQIEFLPDDATLDEYQALQIGLTRPEHAILLSYSKINYFDKILKTHLPEDSYFQQYLLNYFPSLLQEKYKEEILKHPLRREIIATLIVNEVMNRAGATYIYEAMDVTSAHLENIFRAFYVVKNVFDLDRVWREIESLDNRAPADFQMQAMMDVFKIMRRTSFWILRYYPMSDSIQETIDIFSVGIEAFLSHIYDCLDEKGLDRFAAQVAIYQDMKLPRDLAERLSMLQIASSSPDIILISSETGFTVQHVASLYFRVGNRFGFNKVREIIDRAAIAKTSWDRSLVQGILEDVYNYQSDLIVQLLNFAKSQQIGIGDGGEFLLNQWSTANRILINKIEHIFNESHIDINPDLTILTVLSRELRELSGN